MPATEKPLRLEFSVPQSGLTVNAVLQWARTVPVEAGAAMLEAAQVRILTEVLGPAHAPMQVEAAPWACPKCGSTRGFTRRGSRLRRLRTSFGVIVFRLYQVTCLACKRSGQCTTFSPFPALLEIPCRTRVATELLRKGVDMATRLSYAQSSELLQVMTGQGLSAMTIHKQVQKVGEMVQFRSSGKVPILLLDSTKVKAGSKKTGLDVNIALGISGVSQVGNRRRLEKRIVALGFGRWELLTEQLRQVQPELILIDGDDDLEKLVAELYPDVPVQRCLWHLARTFGFNLWRGHVSKLERKQLAIQLRQILYHIQPEKQAQEALRAFADTLDGAHYKYARAGLCKAANTAFTHRTVFHPLVPNWYGRLGRPDRNAHTVPIATSYIEREMREVDRRLDNGTRWSIFGVARLLRLRTLRRYAPAQWAALWSQTGN